MTEGRARATRVQAPKSYALVDPAWNGTAAVLIAPLRPPSEDSAEGAVPGLHRVDGRREEAVVPGLRRAVAAVVPRVADQRHGSADRVGTRVRAASRW